MTVVSDAEHLQQIYTGFKLLDDKNIVNLKQIIPKEFLLNKQDSTRWDDYEFFNITVIINHKIRVLRVTSYHISLQLGNPIVQAHDVP